MAQNVVAVSRVCGACTRLLYKHNIRSLSSARLFHNIGRLSNVDDSYNNQTEGRTLENASSNSERSPSAASLAEFKQYFHFTSASSEDTVQLGQKFTAHGYLTRRRTKHAKLVFADVKTKDGRHVQLTSTFEEDESPAALTNKALRSIRLHSPVSVSGTVAKVYEDELDANKQSSGLGRIDLTLDNIEPLNAFPQDIIISDDVQFPPQARHLQIRFSESLRERLLFRSSVTQQLRNFLGIMGFSEYETPVLFKSTPEGAREFIVPTRRRGHVYALPQSPQQYKQILIASGVMRYFQFARCFRDEDLRADRQPEFTQLDLEMAFATGEDVMQAVESLIRDLLAKISASYDMRRASGEFFPVPKSSSSQNHELFWDIQKSPFPRISYEESMKIYGSDKPDLRIPGEIRRVESVLPRAFIAMITDLKDPAIEAIKIRFDSSVKDTSTFVRSFMDSLPTALGANPHGAPTVLIFDSNKPINGLSSLGHEGYTAFTSGEPGLEDFADLQNGDILVFQAREKTPFHGGSTALGNLRLALYHEAVSCGLLPRDDSFNFLWVHNFPLFTPNNETDPGQGGRAGFSSTHHPFTAPLTDADFDLLATDPLKARADHYDLVVNGVELGGGSRRIHVAQLQEHVFRNILQMSDAGVAQFAHLLEALRAGCPPHAGFALGFDRLVAVLSGTGSVRDVIAFPKSMKGEDLLVRSPGKVTREQLEVYHLAMRKGE